MYEVAADEFDWNAEKTSTAEGIEKTSLRFHGSFYHKIKANCDRQVFSLNGVKRISSMTVPFAAQTLSVVDCSYIRGSLPCAFSDA